jgi:hypothetical protein
MAPGTSGGSGGGGGNYYIPTGLQSADQQWQALQTGNYNTYNNTDLQQYGGQSLNAGMQAYDNTAPGYQNAANMAGSQYSMLGQQLQGAAGQQFGAQTGLLNAGQQLYQTSLDPQNALYNRTVQQLQDQTGATNSMYGLGSSAAGAGVANQALGNFNIDWQNQQLQRQATGLQGYGAAVGQAGQAAGQGGALGGAGAGYTLQGGQTPYTAGQTLAATPGQLGNTYGQYLNNNVYGPAQSIQGQGIQYMNYGNAAQATPYNAQAQGAGAAGALVSQGINSLGSNPQLQSSLGNLFGGSPSQGYFGNTGSFGDYSGTGYGGFGLGSGASSAYTGAGNTYGFTM